MLGLKQQKYINNLLWTWAYGVEVFKPSCWRMRAGLFLEVMKADKLLFVALICGALVRQFRGLLLLNLNVCVDVLPLSCLVVS